MEDHRAFVFDDGAVVAGVGSEAGGLRDGRGVFTHQSADGEIIDGFEAGFAAGLLFGVKRFAIAREAVADPDIAGSCGKNGVAPPLRGDEMRDGAVGAFGIPVALGDEEKAGRGEIAECAVGKLREREIGIVERAEHVGEHRDGAGDVGGEVGWLAESVRGSVDGDVDAFGLLGAEFEFAGDECAVWLGRGAFESVKEAAPCERRGSGGFAGAGDGDRCREH